MEGQPFWIPSSHWASPLHSQLSIGPTPSPTLAGARPLPSLQDPDPTPWPAQCLTSGFLALLPFHFWHVGIFLSFFYAHLGV